MYLQLNLTRGEEFRLRKIRFSLGEMNLVDCERKCQEYLKCKHFTYFESMRHCSFVETDNFKSIYGKGKYVSGSKYCDNDQHSGVEAAESNQDETKKVLTSKDNIPHSPETQSFEPIEVNGKVCFKS